MPNFEKHIAAGIVIGLFFAYLTNNVWILVITALYSTLPDLDINTSRSFKSYVILTCLYAIYMLLLPQEYMGNFFGYEFPQRYFAVPPLLGLLILQFINHREFLHSPVCAILFSIPMLFYAGIPGMLAAVVGYGSHLFLDNELFDGILT